MKKNKRNSVISIQSAKGGVGKTTVALFLAKSYIERDPYCKVFLLGLDFCGTNISSLFENGSRLLTLADIDLYRFSSDDEHNLLNMFINDLHGKVNDNTLKDIRSAVESHGIILLPSGEFDGDIVETPQLLFDELHAQWFCEFLVDLIKTIRKEVDKLEKDIKCYFILDNPPGWSRLLPVLEDVLIKDHDCDPRFVFTSSPDQMDINATFQRIVSLYGKYLKIMNTHRVAAEIKKNGKFEEKLESKKDLEDWYYDEAYLTSLYLCDANYNDEAVVQPILNISELTAITINKTFGIVSLEELENYLNERKSVSVNALIEKIKKEYGIKEMDGVIQEKFKPDIPTALIPFDNDIALIFQSKFYSTKNKEPGPKLLADKRKNDFSSRKDDNPADALNSCDQLAELDFKVYTIFNSPGTSDLQSEFLSMSNFGIFSHMVRSLEVVYSVFQYAFNIFKNRKAIGPRIGERHKQAIQNVIKKQFFIASLQEPKPQHFLWSQNPLAIIPLDIIKKNKDVDIGGLLNLFKGILTNMPSYESQELSVPLRDILHFYLPLCMSTAVLDLQIKPEEIRNPKLNWPKALMRICLDFFIHARIDIDNSTCFCDFKQGFHNKIFEKILDFSVLQIKEIFNGIKLLKKSLVNIPEKHYYLVQVSEVLKEDIAPSREAMLYCRSAFEALYKGEWENPPEVFRSVLTILSEKNIPGKYKKLAWTYALRRELKEFIKFWNNENHI